MRRLSPLKVLRLGLDRIHEIAKAIKEVVPQSEVYLVGGAAEDRLTVLSDIDIAVVLPQSLGIEQCVELRVRIWKVLEAIGILGYVPIELHLVDRKQFEEYMRRGRVVKLA